MRERIRDLEAQVTRLTGLLEQATRTAKRQAAPFSKGEAKKAPQPPGRKPGSDYGTPAFRAAPSPGQIDEVHQAILPARCPTCGGAVCQTRTASQYQVEIPRKPIYRKFNVQVGECTCCGRRVQGRQPERCGSRGKSSRCCRKPLIFAIDIKPARSANTVWR